MHSFPRDSRPSKQTQGHDIILIVMIYLKLFFLSLILTQNTTYAAEPVSYEFYCSWRGGKPSWGRGCYCEKLGHFINPYQKTCLEKSLDNFENIVNGINHKCHTDPSDAHLKRYTHVAPWAIPENIMCNDPARFLCDDRINPYVKNIREASDSFGKLETAAESDSKVLNFLAKNSNKKAKYCFELDIEKKKNRMY
jgi:hypothetical protein